MSNSLTLNCTPKRRWLDLSKPFLAAIFVVGICSLLGWGASLLGLTSANIVMVFLAGVTLVAARYGHWPAVVAAVLGVLIFDYFFVPPVLSFAPSDAQYFVDLAVMLSVGLLISELTARLQFQLSTTQRQEQSTARLYQMSRQLNESAGIDFLLATAGRQLAEIFSGDVALFLIDEDGEFGRQFGEEFEATHRPTNSAAAEWAAKNTGFAGLGTEHFGEATALFVPMIGSSGTLGVLGIRPTTTTSLDDAEQQRILATCANLIALSIERAQSSLAAQEALLQVRTEQFRNHVLSAVSHDLRSPLAMIATTASSLLEESNEKSWQAKRGRLRIVVNEAQRLSRQVENLLRYARVSSGPIVLDRQWHALDDLVGFALTRLGDELGERRVRVRIESNFPLLWIEGQLMEHVLINLLENAIFYTPAGSDLEISATRVMDEVELRIADSGPGLPPGGESELFEKFVRGTSDVDGRRGVGLGLAICKAIIGAHGGQIRAANRPGGGAEFAIFLSCPQRSPEKVLLDANLP